MKQYCVYFYRTKINLECASTHETLEMAIQWVKLKNRKKYKVICNEYYPDGSLKRAETMINT